MFDRRIAELVAAHPDGALFASLPGAGEVLVPRIIAAFGTRRERYQSAYQMQCSGIAPVTETSGNSQLCLSQIPNYMRTWGLRIFLHTLRSAGSVFLVLAAALSATFRSRAALHLENLALRHQLGVLQSSVKRPRLSFPDRLVWAWLCEIWTDWRSALVIVKPQTVIAWHRKGFRLF